MDSRMVTMNQNKLRKLLFEEFRVNNKVEDTEQIKKENLIMDRFMKEFNMKHIDDVDSFIWNVRGNERTAFYKIKNLMGELQNEKNI